METVGGLTRNAMSSSSESEIAAAVDEEDDGIDSMFVELRRRGVKDDTLRKLQDIMETCTLTSMPVLRLFANSLPMLVEGLFEESVLGKLQAKGLLAQIRDCAMIPPEGVGVPLATGHDRNRGSKESPAPSTSNASSSCPSRILAGVAVINPDDVILPRHLRAEAKRLRHNASSDNPLSEPQCRGLCLSAAIWLARQGVICRSTSPRVIERFGELLHELLPMSVLQVPKGRKCPVPFADRINNAFVNKLRRRGADGKFLYPLQVRHDEVLEGPLKALECAGMLVRCEPDVEPIQGHSGKSIIGRGRRLAVHDLPSPLRSPPLFASSEDTVQDAAGKVEQEKVEQEKVELEPASSAPGAAETHATATVGSKLNVASMLSGLAHATGLDVVVTRPGRSPASSLFTPAAQDLATPLGDTEMPPEEGAATVNDSSAESSDMIDGHRFASKGLASEKGGQNLLPAMSESPASAAVQVHAHTRTHAHTHAHTHTVLLRSSIVQTRRLKKLGNCLRVRIVQTRRLKQAGNCLQGVRGPVISHWQALVLRISVVQARRLQNSRKSEPMTSKKPEPMTSNPRTLQNKLHVI